MDYGSHSSIRKEVRDQAYRQMDKGRGIVSVWRVGNVLGKVDRLTSTEDGAGCVPDAG